MVEEYATLAGIE